MRTSEDYLTQRWTQETAQPHIQAAIEAMRGDGIDPGQAAMAMVCYCSGMISGITGASKASEWLQEIGKELERREQRTWN